MNLSPRSGFPFRSQIEFGALLKFVSNLNNATRAKLYAKKNCLTLVKKLLRDWYNAVFRLGHETHNVFEKKNLKGKIFLLWHKSQVFKSHANISFVYLKFRALKKTISQSEIQNGSIITENYSTLQICILFFVY